MNAGGVLTLFLAVALAALHARELLGVRHLLHIAMAICAVESGVRRGLQARCIETWGNTRLALPNTRPGIVAALAILGTRGRRRR